MAEEKRGFGDALNRAQKSLLDLFFPRKCPFCGTLVGKDLLCSRCRDTLPRNDGVRSGAGFGRCAAPLRYEGPVRDAVLRYKFNSRLDYLACFGRMMAQTAAEEFSGEFDAITWVPVSKKRLRKRGYDQARYLASSVCVDWHVVPQETLRKIRDNQPQSGLTDRKERRANVLGVYEAVNPAEIAGKRFLLIDDIFTTGATLSECVRVLKDAGAQEVMCLTLAITPENETAASGAE